MARKRKPRPAASDEPAVLTPPIVAEAATDVEVEQPLLLERTDWSSPTTVTPWDEPIPPLPYDVQVSAAPQSQLLPVVVPEWDRRAMQIGAGKLIAKHLRVPPASAQLQAGQLTDEQIRWIMAASLAADPAEQIRAAIATQTTEPCDPCA